MFLWSDGGQHGRDLWRSGQMAIPTGRTVTGVANATGRLCWAETGRTPHPPEERKATNADLSRKTDAVCCCSEKPEPGKEPNKRIFRRLGQGSSAKTPEVIHCLELQLQSYQKASQPRPGVSSPLAALVKRSFGSPDFLQDKALSLVHG